MSSKNIKSTSGFIFLTLFLLSCSHGTKNADQAAASDAPRSPAALDSNAIGEPVSQDTYRILDSIKTDMESTLQKGQKSIRK